MQSTPKPPDPNSPSGEPGGIFTIRRRFKLEHPGWSLTHDLAAPDYRAFVATRTAPLTEEERAAGLQDTIKGESPQAVEAFVRIEQSKQDLWERGHAASSGGAA